jgi:hypothetical protein
VNVCSYGAAFYSPVTARPRPATILDVAEIKAALPQKNPRAEYTLGVVRSLLPHLGFWTWRQVSGDTVPPSLAYLNAI